jgi:hypothetical protein
MSSPDRLADPRPRGSDQAGNWLSERYQLNAADRNRVKIATLRGEPVSDPRLNEAVRGLASEILDNRLRLPGSCFATWSAQSAALSGSGHLPSH